MRQLPADTDSISGSAAAQVAVGLEPSVRAVETLPVVLVRLGERGSEYRELEFVLIDLLAAADQLSSDLLAGPGCNSPTPLSILRLYEQTFGKSRKVGVNFAGPKLPRAYRLRTCAYTLFPVFRSGSADLDPYASRHHTDLDAPAVDGEVQPMPTEM